MCVLVGLLAQGRGLSSMGSKDSFAAALTVPATFHPTEPCDMSLDVECSRSVLTHICEQHGHVHQADCESLLREVARLADERDTLMSDMAREREAWDRQRKVRFCQLRLSVACCTQGNLLRAPARHPFDRH